MPNSKDQHQPPSKAKLPNYKRLGGHLIEAGLLTPAQVDVALNDQKSTGLSFGEVVVARGWVKQQTIEYLMKKVILPEQAVLLTAEQSALRRTRSGQVLSASGSTAANQSEGETDRSASLWCDLPIAKPPPSAGSSEGGVSWVG